MSLATTEREAIAPALSGDFLSVEQLSAEGLESVHQEADYMHRMAREFGTSALLEGSVYSLIFWDSNSTRTKTSFELAISRLGGTAHVFHQETSSGQKGETFLETVEQIDSMLIPKRDGFIIRHKETGNVAAAAEIADARVINAGDGSKGEHPTQGVLDTYTMRRRMSDMGGVANARTVFFGDLAHARTINATAKLLAIMGQREMDFVAPHPSLTLSKSTMEFLLGMGVSVHETDDLRDVAPGADFLYAVRTQDEHMTKEEFEAVKGLCVVTPEMVEHSDALIMHPYPQNQEDINIHPELRWSPRCIVKEQAGGGLYTRMAELAILAGKSILDDERTFDWRLRDQRAGLRVV